MISKVLLVDDSEAESNRNEILLKSMGVSNNIVKFSNPTLALKYLRDQNINAGDTLPDLIFLDLEMPNMDGFGFLNEYSNLLSEFDEDNLPFIVILSDHLLEEENLDKTNQYKFAGVVDHLKKPIDREDVQMILEEYFEDFSFDDTIIFSEIMLPLEPFKQLLPGYFREIQEECESLKNAVFKEDLMRVRQTAHKIKGVSASYYAAFLSQKAAQIQKCVDTDQTDQLQTLVVELEEAVSLTHKYAKENFGVEIE